MDVRRLEWEAKVSWSLIVCFIIGIEGERDGSTLILAQARARGLSGWLDGLPAFKLP